MIVALFVGNAFSFSSQAEIQQYYLDGFAAKNVPVIADAGVQITIPSYIQPDLSQSNLDIDYWISTLPAKYQSENEYFIYPKAGIIIPIVNFSPADKRIVDQWLSVDHFTYLEKGAVHHRWKKPQQWKGNFTIAGHTSFEKDLPGDFKTNMQWIILADAWDTVLYVHKKDASTWERYIYTVTQSFETTADNVSILLDNPQVEHELTVYGCSPIGTTEKRRVMKSTLQSVDTVAIDNNVKQAVHGSAPDKQSPNNLSWTIVAKQTPKVAPKQIDTKEIKKVDTAEEKLRKSIYRMPLRTEDNFTRMIGFFKLIVDVEKQWLIPTLYEEHAQLMKQIIFQRLVWYVKTHKQLIQQVQEVFSDAN